MSAQSNKLFVFSGGSAGFEMGRRWPVNRPIERFRQANKDQGFVRSNRRASMVGRRRRPETELPPPEWSSHLDTSISSTVLDAPGLYPIFKVDWVVSILRSLSAGRPPPPSINQVGYPSRPRVPLSISGALTRPLAAVSALQVPRRSLEDHWFWSFGPDPCSPSQQT